MIRFEKTLLVACLIATGCSAQGKQAPAVPNDQRPAMTTEGNLPKMPEMTKEQVMEAMKMASTPGEQHSLLKQYVGTWKTTAKMWTNPSAPPEVTKGTATNRMILGGRFLEQKYTGTAHGTKFEGQGITGYDNVGNQYVSNWVDTMGTGQFTEAGTYDPAAKVIAMKGSMLCPMNSQEMPARTAISMVDKGSYTFEMYATDPGSGKEQKIVEITYSKGGGKKLAAVKPEKK